jgi:hypothetical protein
MMEIAFCTFDAGLGFVELVVNKRLAHTNNAEKTFSGVSHCLNPLCKEHP